MSTTSIEKPSADVPKIFDTLSPEDCGQRAEAFVTEAFACRLRCAMTSRDAPAQIARFVARAHASGLMNSWTDDEGHHVIFLSVGASADTMIGALETWLMAVGVESQF